MRNRHGMIAGALAASLLLAVAPVSPAAKSKPKRTVSFKLKLPKEGGTSTRVFKVNLVKRSGTSRALKKTGFKVIVPQPGSVPKGTAISGRMWRSAKTPRKATIAITAFRPKASSRRRVTAQAAQDDMIGIRTRTTQFDIGIFAGGAYTTDWFDIEPDLPPNCLVPSTPPLEGSDHPFVNFPYNLDLVWSAYVSGVCNGQPDPFQNFMQTGSFETDQPPTIRLQAFAGNPREGSIFITDDDPFNAVKVVAKGNNTFIQCFSSGRPCTVDSPGSPNNFILFTFPAGPVTDSGELNARSGNQDFSSWAPPGFFLSTDGGATFGQEFAPGP